MQINIQISDELIHQDSAVSTPSVIVDTRPSPYATTDAMSGGAAPGGTALSPAQVPYDALSAGSAEQQLAPVTPSTPGQANNNGGPAPS
jgi:hypothetical protein